MRFVPFAIGALLLGCGSDLKLPDRPDAGGAMTGDTPRITTVENGNGTFTSVVDASDETKWVYFDLETRAQVEPANAADSTEWDLAFSRFKVAINGGISGTGGMGAIKIANADFNAITRPPGGDVVTDEADSDDVGEIDDYALNRPNEGETGPFDYDPMNHTLSASGTVFAVRSVDGNWYKITFVDYYNDAGSPGYPKLTWAPLGTPLAAGTFEIPAARNTYFKIDGTIVAPFNPSTSLDWDLLVNQAGWSTNGGPTRAGLGGARLSAVDYDLVTRAPTTGYAIDAEIPFPGAPGANRFYGNDVLSDWFTYDASMHTATSKGLTYFVRTSSGTYGRLTIVSYDNDKFAYTVEMSAIERDVQVVTTTLDGRAGWSYFSFTRGAEVDPTNSFASMEWDIGVNGVRIRTNGGSSGPGRGAARQATTDDLAAIASAPQEGYDIDADGAGGSMNPALAAWFETTMTSTTPRNLAFILRTADGGYSKLKITGYAAGAVTFDWAYAGAGQTDF